MCKKTLFLILILILLINLLYAESKEKLQKRNATKAVLYSLFVPGGGQLYNKKYLKAGIEFTAESILIGYTIHYQIKINDAWDRYLQTKNYEEYSRCYDKYNPKQQNMLWWLAIFKFLSVVDAFVDAKLYNYEEKKKKIELKFKGIAVSLDYRFW